MNKFERTSFEKLDGIIKIFKTLNNSINEGFLSLTSSIDNIGNTLSNMSSSLDSISSSVGLNNIIQGISTYQLYKIKKSLNK